MRDPMVDGVNDVVVGGTVVVVLVGVVDDVAADVGMYGGFGDFVVRKTAAVDGDDFAVAAVEDVVAEVVVDAATAAAVEGGDAAAAASVQFGHWK